MLEFLPEVHPAPWGTVLDAGTGATSLPFVVEVGCTSWTAVTADSARAEHLRQRHGPAFRPQDRLLVGNWQSPELLTGERFEVVLADDLIGSCERYAPHFQERLLVRLWDMTQDWLFLVGREPWAAPQGPGQQLLDQLARTRDAILLLAGRRPHREMPRTWVEQHMPLAPTRVRREEAWYDQDFLSREVSAMEKNLEELSDRGLAQVLKRRCAHLKQLGASQLPCSYGEIYLLAYQRKAACSN